MENFSLKAIARDAVIIVALTGVAGLYTSLAMPGKLGTVEYASISRLLTLLLGTLGFLGIASSSPTIRWRQLLIVGAVMCVIDAVFNLLWLGNPVRIWTQNSFHFGVMLIVGGAFSYVLPICGRPHSKGAMEL